MSAGMSVHGAKSRLSRRSRFDFRSSVLWRSAFDMAFPKASATSQTKEEDNALLRRPPTRPNASAFPSQAFVVVKESGQACR